MKRPTALLILVTLLVAAVPDDRNEPIRLASEPTLST